jgi:TatD DNase family protein
MKLIDTHTHLFSDKFESDRHEAVQRAIDAGVERMYLPNISRDTTDSMNALVDAFPAHCFAMMGLHPCHVDEHLDAELAHVEQELASGRYSAVGETGLDYHWDTSFAEQQKDALRQQIGWAKKFQLPIVLHTRESFDDTYELIAEQNDDSLTGVFHCFGGSVSEAEKVAELGGFYIGIGGVATFAKSNHPEVLPAVPVEMIVLETDAPYLAPKPHRGKRNESAYLPRIAERVAEIKGMAVDEIAAVTTANALQLYKDGRE